MQAEIAGGIWDVAALFPEVGLVRVLADLLAEFVEIAFKKVAEDGLEHIPSSRFCSGRVHHEIKGANDRVAHLAAVDYGVDHSVFEEKFASLKAFGKFLTDRLL